MRLRPQDLKVIYLRQRVSTQNDEGDWVKAWGDPVELRVNIQPATGQFLSTLYGDKLPRMKSLKYQGENVVENRDEKAGLCVSVSKDEEPDYTITSIMTYSDHLNILAMRNEGASMNGSRD
ncbi:hypothetical protein [Lacticaseibacillus saniviri]